MGSIFGKPKQEPAPARPQVQVSSKDRAMLDLKVARDKLKKYQKRVSDAFPMLSCLDSCVC